MLGRELGYGRIGNAGQDRSSRLLLSFLLFFSPAQIHTELNQNTHFTSQSPATKPNPSSLSTSLISSFLEVEIPHITRLLLPIRNGEFSFPCFVCVCLYVWFLLIFRPGYLSSASYVDFLLTGKRVIWVQWYRESERGFLTIPPQCNCVSFFSVLVSSFFRLFSLA